MREKRELVLGKAGANPARLIIGLTRIPRISLLNCQLPANFIRCGLAIPIP